MPDWLFWLIAAGVLAAAETVTLTFVLIMIAGGAAAAALTAALGGPVVLQILVAVLATVALLGLARPVARRHLASGPSSITGSDALVGQEAVVLTQVDAYDGRVRLNGGEWSARALEDDEVMSAGQIVRVIRIVGATAVVAPDRPSVFGGSSW